ncbi:MAG: PD-(D/E)XK nuclease family protein [Myxococcota bacterium]
MIEIAKWLQSAREAIEEIDRKDRSRAPRFNIFRELRIDRDEVRTHSRMLAALLDPKGSHAQGDLFLRHFLANEKVAECLGGSVSNRWSIAVEDPHPPYGRFDILMRSEQPKRIVVIENKVDASEGGDQCQRYAEWLDEVGRAGEIATALVYLTPDGREAVSLGSQPCAYVRLSYYDIAVCLGQALEEDVPTKLETVVRQYIEVCREVAYSKAGGGVMGLDHDLLEYLGQGKNAEVAFRIGAALPELRRTLVHRYFEAVGRGVDEVCGSQRTGLSREEGYMESSRDPYLTLNAESNSDAIGVSVQISGDQQMLGVCWNQQREPGYVLPEAVAHLREVAVQALEDRHGPDSWWVARTNCRKTVEDACREIAESGSRAVELGRELGNLMQRIEGELRAANRSLLV